jgi:hypothetical protein
VARHLGRCSPSSAVLKLGGISQPNRLADYYMQAQVVILIRMDQFASAVFAGSPLECRFSAKCTRWPTEGTGSGLGALLRPESIWAECVSECSVLCKTGNE